MGRAIEELDARAGIGYFAACEEFEKFSGAGDCGAMDGSDREGLAGAGW